MGNMRMPEPKLPARCFAVLEKDVQLAVVQLLELDGWRPVRTEHAIERNAKGGFKRRVGETGMPDYLFLRYLCDCDLHRPNLSNIPACEPGLHNCNYPSRDGAQHIWIEFKRPGGKPRADQALWHQGEAVRGALVMVVDEFDAFREWYQQSGLYRRTL